MDSSSTLCNTTKVTPKECATKSPRKKHHPQYSSRRSPSFTPSSSLSSSSSSNFADEAYLSPLSPATPLPFSGVPFSWEKLPGIPKKQASKKKETGSVAANHLLLPLPPSGTGAPPSSKRYICQEEPAGLRKLKNHHHHHHHHHHRNNKSFEWDPFVAALVECSKDDHQETHAKGNNNANYLFVPKVSRTIGDPLGIISLYSSCKRSCAVSESIINLPRSNRRSTYDLIYRHSS